MQNKFYLIVAFMAVIFVGCSDRNDGGKDPGSNESTKIKYLSVPESFEWSTGKNVVLIITGLPTLEPITSTLSIGLKDGTVLYKQLHEMSKSLVVKVSVPSIETMLKLTYGTVSYEVPVNGYMAEFSFIPVIEDTKN